MVWLHEFESCSDSYQSHWGWSHNQMTHSLKGWAQRSWETTNPRVWNGILHPKQGVYIRVTLLAFLLSLTHPSRWGGVTYLIDVGESMEAKWIGPSVWDLLCWNLTQLWSTRAGFRDGGGSWSARLADGWVILPHKILNDFAWYQF